MFINYLVCDVQGQQEKQTEKGTELMLPDSPTNCSISWRRGYEERVGKRSLAQQVSTGAVCVCLLCCFV